MFFNFLAETTGSSTGGSSYTMLIMLVVMFVLMYFLMLRPQKKRQKEEQEMRDNVEVGDEIITIGGICGRVVIVKDDTIIIETGADRNKLKFKKWSIQQNVTATEKLAAERAAAREAAEKAKAEKKASKKSKKDKE
ncbi:MAG: preprotein translocase subunit YajC [Acutalibacteraceae bacterium]|nr:preprotein translocase subunit YajC [Oscillospiraceae bacterium]